MSQTDKLYIKLMTYFPRYYPKYFPVRYRSKIYKGVWICHNTVKQLNYTLLLIELFLSNSYSIPLKSVIFKSYFSIATTSAICCGQIRGWNILTSVSLLSFLKRPRLSSHSDFTAYILLDFIYYLTLPCQ